VVVSGEGFHQASRTFASIRLRGEDEWFDDRITISGFGGAQISGGTFADSAIVDGQILNEDWGEDDIYAIVSVEGYGDRTTNTVHGDF
jgi:hypothetical protein